MARAAWNELSKQEKLVQIDRAILIAAEIIVLHGDKYGPLLDRLERERAILENSDDPTERAKRYLVASGKQV